MSVQIGEQHYSHEAVPKQIDTAPIIGGPPLPNFQSIPDFQPLQATGCTAGDIDLYNSVQHAVECAIASEGPNVGPLGQSVILAEAASQPPISCMMELITGPYSDCGEEIPSDKRKAAYDSFVSITGYKPIDWNHALNHLNDQQKKILNFNAFYIFFPIFLLSVIIIWIMVGFGWINWVIGLFFTGLVFIILYGFSILYRIHVHSFLNQQNQQLQRDVSNAQHNFENSIAYWPQGLFAVACAVTATGDTGSWRCNEPGDCPDCPTVSSDKISRKSRKAIRGSSVCGGAKCQEGDVIHEEAPKLVRRKRLLRRKKE